MYVDTYVLYQISFVYDTVKLFQFLIAVTYTLFVFKNCACIMIVYSTTEYRRATVHVYIYVLHTVHYSYITWTVHYSHRIMIAFAVGQKLTCTHNFGCMHYINDVTDS